MLRYGAGRLGRNHSSVTSGEAAPDGLTGRLGARRDAQLLVDHLHITRDSIRGEVQLPCRLCDGQAARDQGKRFGLARAQVDKRWRDDGLIAKMIEQERKRTRMKYSQ